jgi:hypothetical protein
VTTIGNQAFQKTDLTSVTLGSAVTIIGSGAFADTLLASIEIFPNFDSITLTGFEDDTK